MDSKRLIWTDSSERLLMDANPREVEQMDSNRVFTDGYEASRPDGYEVEGFHRCEAGEGPWIRTHVTAYGFEHKAMCSICIDDILSVRPRIDLKFGMLPFVAFPDLA